MQSFSTAAVPCDRRLDYWNGLASDYLMPMDITPRAGEARQDFVAELLWQSLGPISISRARSSLAELQRTRSHISRCTERAFLLNLADAGSFAVRQSGNVAVLGVGDFTLSDSTEPFVITHAEPCSAIVLRIPEKVMTSYVARPEDFVGRRIAAGEGLGQVVSVMLRSLGSQIGGGLEEPLNMGVAHAILELLASLYSDPGANTTRESVVTRRRRVEIRNFIEENLLNPDLSPGMVAASLKISSRHMRNMFSYHGESVSEYIMRRRLDEASRRLQDPAWAGRTISEIAFNWGFNSLGSFERAFKGRYGMPPREYRFRKGTHSEMVEPDK